MDISDLIKFNSVKLNLRKLKNNFNLKDRLYTKHDHLAVDKRSNFILKTGFICFLILNLVFIYQAFSLQIKNYDKYRNLAERNFLRNEIILPFRGLISDRNGEILVKNVPKYVLNQNLSKCMIKKDKNYDNCLKELSAVKSVVDIDIDNVKKLYEKSELVTIKRELNKDEALKIGSLSNLNSIEITIFPQREYTYDESFAHILGYVGQSDSKIGVYQGKQGIESFYNNYLSGVPGLDVYKSDSLNNKLEEYSQISPINGKNMVLTIDAKLQNYSYEILQEKIKSYPNALGGTIIAHNPQNGEVLALVNYPSFSINKMTRGISEKEFTELVSKNDSPFLNRAISGLYPPGSVFKLVTGSAILEEGIASPKDTIFDQGFIVIGNNRYANWKLDGHGIVDFTRAMKVSNDTYYYIYSGGYGGVKPLGISGIHKWGEKFNFGKLTEIDLPSENPGFLPDGKYKDWFLGDTFITAIGQGDLLSTPIQVSVLTSYFATDQKSYVPKIVKEIDNFERKDRILFEKLMSEENFSTLKNSLKEVNLPGGTAFPFFDFEKVHGFSSAGKTGTSEYYDSRFGKILIHAWYSGFAPYEKGEIVVTVFLESGGGGSTDAAPIARKVMDFYFQNIKK